MRIASSRAFVFVFLVCSGLTCFQLLGQTGNGSIVGVITDNSGAGTPDAKVTLTNIGTAAEQSVQSGNTGEYRFVSVPPGNYQLAVEHAGFERVVRRGFTVEVGAEVRIDVALQVGAVTETVNVSAAAPLLETENASVSTEVDTKQVADLALNGRNVMNLIELAPGVIQGTGASGNPIANTNGGTVTTVTAWMNYQIGGGQLNQSTAFLDGAPISNPQDNTSVLVPVQDSVQEFRIISNDVSAEIGKFAGGAVIMVTKSGTNEFHGGAYEYLRNKDLNANYYFNNINGAPVPQYTLNQYGAFLGGPVKKDKLFFFFGWENYVYRQQTPTLANVPTLAMKEGNFSQVGLPTIYDPNSVCGVPGNNGGCPVTNGVVQYIRQPFPGNIIPTSRILPVATLIGQGWSLPDAAGSGSSAAPVNNYNSNQTYGGDQHQYVPRVDYNVSDKQRIFARYTFWDGISTPAYPYTLPAYPGVPAIEDLVGMSGDWTTQNAVVGDNYVLSPTTDLGVRVAWSRFVFSGIQGDYQGTGTVGCNATTCPSGASYLSQLAALGAPAYVALEPQYAQTLPLGTSVQNFSFPLGSIADTYSHNNLYTISGDLTKIKGSHTIKMGAETRVARWDQWTANGPGILNFNNLWTSQNPLSSGGSGYSWADVLLGLPTTGSDSVARPISMYNRYSGLYITDTFQASRKLTLTAGLRWDIPVEWHEAYARGAVFDPSAPNPDAAAIGLPVQGAVALFNSTLDPRSTVFPTHWKEFAPRLGLAYRVKESTVVRAGYALAYVPLDTTLTSASPPSGPAATGLSTYVDSLNGGITPAATVLNPWPSGLVQPAGTNPATVILNSEGQTLTIPLGNARMPYVQQWNVNLGHEFGHQMMAEVAYAGLKGTHLAMAGAFDINQLPDQYDSLGQSLIGQVTNPLQSSVLPGGTLASTTIMEGQFLRPFPEYQNVGIPSYFVGNSTYNSLQAKFQKRLFAGGTIGVAYTWSKLIADTGSGNPVQDYTNLAGGKSLSGDNAAQRLVISYTADLPFGHGRALFSSAPTAVNAVISGWGVNGVTTLQSGLPLSLTYGGTNDLSSFGAGSIRPNVVAGCNPNEPGSAEQKETRGEWFNLACFTAPATVFSFGDEPRVDPTLRAQGITNFDVALRRDIRFHERYGLEIRGEVFNIANHIRFTAPGTAIGTGTAGQIQATVGSQQNQPRTIQLAMRFTF